jgi:4-amino-4-deoxy-L-arabinose transferase-like glycosyltransferase
MDTKPLLRLIDAIWLVALCAFILSGVQIAPYHGDESTQLYLSVDVDRALRGQWDSLRADWITGDAAARQRLLSRPLFPYIAGAARHLSGAGAVEAPTRPWNWAGSYDDNLRWGNVALPAVLFPARTAAALLLCGALIALFALAARVGGRPAAYSASLLFALHPVVLLNGRRALPESASLLFGIVSVWLAAVISRRRETKAPVGLLRWAALAAAGGLALSSAFDALLYVAAALAWLLVGELLRANGRVLRLLPRVAGALVGGALLAFALAPALWNSPIARLADIARERAANLGAPLTLVERVVMIVRQPFLAPPQYWEASGFESASFAAQRAFYDASPVSGLRLAEAGVVGAGVAAFLTAMVIVGVVVVWMPRLSKNPSPSAAVGMTLWLALTILALLANPLPWQRLYLPLIAVSTLCAGVALGAALRELLLRDLRPQPRPLPAAARELPEAAPRFPAAPEPEAPLSPTPPEAEPISPAAPTTPNHRMRVIAAAWLLALTVYALLGIDLAPYHGDESTYLFASADFDRAILHGEWASLPVDDLSETRVSYERLMNGSVFPYTAGLVRWLAGFTAEQMPQGWMWLDTYDINLAFGVIPGDALLLPVRALSALYLGGAVVLMFLLAYRFGGWLPAFAASGLYALNAPLLLQARRALPEGAMQFLGLAVVLLAAVIAERRLRGARVGLALWVGLAVTSALVFVTKQTGLLFVAAGAAWIIMPEVFRFLLTRRPGRLLGVLAHLIGMALAFVALSYALSPGLWGDPLARLNDLYRERVNLVAVQVSLDPIGAMTTTDRVLNVIQQPFMTPVQYWESFGFADSAAFQATVRAYDASPLAGLRPGWFGGAFLTAMALIGLFAAWSPRRAAWTASLGIWMWLGGVALALILLNPLAWQRYYMPLIPPLTLLAGIGIAAAVADLRLRRSRRQPESPPEAPVSADAPGETP